MTLEYNLVTLQFVHPWGSHKTIPSNSVRLIAYKITLNAISEGKLQTWALRVIILLKILTVVHNTNN